MRIDVRALCDVGCVRPHNEDMILVGTDFLRDRGLQRDGIEIGAAPFICAVADGMGGMDAGDKASRFVLERLLERSYTLPPSLSVDELSKEFSAFANETNAQLPANSGSTLAGFLFLNGLIYRFHAGDSRLWRYNHGVLERLTQDHSLREMGGDPTAPGNIILNSIGGGASAFIDFAALPQLQTGEYLLASSDGLHDVLALDEIQALLSEGLDRAPSALLKATKQRSGKDNISILLIQIQDQDLNPRR